MKSMLMHSFVLDALDTTGADTFSHFEMLIDEHRSISMTSQRLIDIHFNSSPNNAATITTAAAATAAAAGTSEVHHAIIPPPPPSRLTRLVPSIGTFHTRLPLRRAFEAYNAKYGVTKRRYVCISFNEIRHILNLAQIMAMIQPKGEGDGSGGGEGGGGGVGVGMVDSPRLWESSPPPLSLDKMKIDDGALVVKEEEESNAQEEGKFIKADKMLSSSQRTNDDDALLSSEKHCESSIGEESLERLQHQHQCPIRKPLDRHERSESDVIIEETYSLLPMLHSPLPGPKLICFDGDQTLYCDGANFEKSPNLAKYICLLLQHGVTIAVVTAAGYEYHAAKYELRLSGLIAYFQERNLEKSDLERFYIFGGECNYLLRLGQDYHLHAVREDGPGGWMTSTKYLSESPGNWRESDITSILDMSEECFRSSLIEQNMRATIIRKKRSVGLIPKADEKIPREALDETVLRTQTLLDESKVTLPFCAFNGGRDAWVDVGNKRVGVTVLQSYLGIPVEETLHIGDQFLYTGNDFAARSVCPCVWITSPEETTYILKSILRLAGVPLMASMKLIGENLHQQEQQAEGERIGKKIVDFEDLARRTRSIVKMDVYTGEFIGHTMTK